MVREVSQKGKQDTAGDPRVLGDFGMWVCEKVSAGPEGGAGRRVTMHPALRVAQKMAKLVPAFALPGRSMVSRDLGSLQERPGLRNIWVPRAEGFSSQTPPKQFDSHHLSHNPMQLYYKLYDPIGDKQFSILNLSFPDL